VRDFVVERNISHNTHQVPPTGTLETHLEFACVSQQEYEDHPEEYGSLLDTPKEEDPAIATEEDKEDFNRICDNEQDDFDDEVEEEQSVDNDVILDEPTLTPFIKLWRVLSQWMTHDTLTLLNTWEKNEIFESTMKMDHILYPTANDDPLTTTHSPSQAEQQQTVVAARYQGLIAMLKIHLPTCIEVLGVLQYASITYKGAEDRLGALVASFDLYSTDMTFTSMHLDSSILWRACTMILLDIACFCHDSQMDSHHDTRTIQTHIQTLGLSMEEYTYLTRQALKSLCTQYTTPLS
jgi:hypothetical protein